MSDINESPLKRLQQGIYNKDWSEVEAGFEAVFGIQLYHSVPEIKTKTKPKKIKTKVKPKAITKPAKPLYEDEDEELIEEDEVKRPAKAKIKANSTVEGLESDKTCARRLPYDAQKVKRIGNKFKDTGAIAKADKKIDKLLFQEPLVERSRKSSIVKATCCVCHKTHSVSKSLIHNGKYRCNNCCMGGHS